MKRRNSRTGPSFMIKIHGSQNATWQGSLSFLDTRKTVNFRSALEMIKLMDESIEGGWETKADSPAVEYREPENTQAEVRG